MKKIIAFILSFVMILCAFPVSSFAENDFMEINNSGVKVLRLNGDSYIHCRFEAYERSRLADDGFSKIFVEERKGLSWQEVGVKDTGITYEDTPDRTLHYIFFKTEPHGEKVRVRFEKGALISESTGKVNKSFAADYIIDECEFKVSVNANTTPQENKMPENTFILGEAIHIYMSTSIGPYKVFDTATGNELQLNNGSFIPETPGKKEYEFVGGGGLLKTRFTVNIMEKDEYFAASEERIRNLEELKREHAGELFSYIRGALKESMALYFGFMMAVPALFITVPVSPIIVAVLTCIVGVGEWESSLINTLQ